MAFKLKGFPMIAGTKPMKLMKDSAMKMKKAAMQMKKDDAAMKMGHSPKKMAKDPMKFNAGLRKASAEGKLDNNPKFKAAVDNAPTKMKKSAMKLKGEAMKLKGEAMKMKSPMKQDKKKGKITKDEQGRVIRRTHDAALDKTVQNIMKTTPGITLAAAKKEAKKQLKASM